MSTFWWGPGATPRHTARTFIEEVKAAVEDGVRPGNHEGIESRAHPPVELKPVCI